MDKLLLFSVVMLLGLSVVACSSSDSEEVERLKQEIEALKAAPTATATPAPKPTSTPRPTPTPILGPSLEFISFRCYTEYGFAFVEGQVKNITNKKMDNVMATVDWYSSGGTFITSDEALISYNPLLPNQTSSFKTITTLNPEMSKCGVGFKYLMGGVIDFKSPTPTATPTPTPRPTATATPISYRGRWVTPTPTTPTPTPTPTPSLSDDEALARILSKPNLAAMVEEFGGIGEIHTFEYKRGHGWNLIADFPMEKVGVNAEGKTLIKYCERTYHAKLSWLNGVNDSITQRGLTTSCKTY